MNLIAIKQFIISHSKELLSSALVVIAPIKPTLIAVSVLVFADFITGIWAALKKKERISSNGINKSLMKSFAYMLFIIVAFVIEKYLIDDVPVIKVVSAMITLRESKSFFENMKVITGLDLMDSLLSKMHQSTAKNIPQIEQPSPEVEPPVEDKPKKKKRKKRKKRK